MATLVNGNGNPAVYAQQDADLYVGVMGTTSCIMSVGSKFAATIETANLISVADGVILTKEGRRIQTDVGEVDEFNIPNGAAGVTRYYIIGYHLYTDGQGSQKCETFVQLMSSATDTIPEAEFRNGATEVYVSLYRVTQVGLTLNDPESLLPDALNIGDINASLTELAQNESFRYNEETDYLQCKVDGVWTDYKKAGMKLYKIFYDGQFHNGQQIGAHCTRSGYAHQGNMSVSDGYINLPTVSLSSSDRTTGGGYFSEKVDLTNYNTIHVVNSGGIDHPLDVSGYSGEYYIAMYDYREGTASPVYKVGINAVTGEYTTMVASANINQTQNMQVYLN